MNCSMPDFPVLHHLLELAQTCGYRVGDAIQPSHPLSSPSPPAFSLPTVRVFSSESVLRIRWPKYCCFSFSISLAHEYSVLISFRKGLKSLLQNHSSKASILWRTACFLVQPSHPYMTTGKTIALTKQIFVGKVMSLLFNMLSRFV